MVLQRRVGWVLGYAIQFLSSTVSFRQMEQTRLRHGAIIGQQTIFVRAQQGGR